MLVARQADSSPIGVSGGEFLTLCVLSAVLSAVCRELLTPGLLFFPSVLVTMLWSRFASMPSIREFGSPARGLAASSPDFSNSNCYSLTLEYNTIQKIK